MRQGTLSLLILLGTLALVCGCGPSYRYPEYLLPFEITVTVLPDAVVNSAYSVSVAAQGGTRPYGWSISAGKLPDGLELDPKSGAISGTPTREETAEFTVQVSDSSSPPQTVSKEFSIRVVAGLEITTEELPDGTVAFNYSAKLEKSGGTEPVTWSLSFGELPDGLSLNSESGEIFGLPTSEGSSIFGIRLQDSGVPAQDILKNFSITILPGTPGVIARASVASDGTEADGDSAAPSISAGARQVAFESAATNLVAGDTNGAIDIFLFELVTASTGRVSVATGGAQANGASHNAALTGDGEVAVFDSVASNLVSGDSNGVADIFVRLIPAETSGRVSVHSDGTQADRGSTDPATGDAARFVAFTTLTNFDPNDQNGGSDIYVRDRQSGTTTWVSRIIRASPFSVNHHSPAISADGQVIAFESAAPDLVSPVTSGINHIFAGPVGGGAGSLELVSVALRLPNQTADRVGPDSIGNSSLNMTPNEHVGRRVVIAEGTGAGQVRLISSNTTTTLVVATLWTTTPDESSVFRVVEEADGASTAAAVSGDGRFIAFESTATNLAPGDSNSVSDIFVHDRDTGETFRVSLVLELGNQTADRVAPDSIGNSSLSMIPDEHVGRLVEIVQGSGAGQVRLIVSNTDTTLTVDRAWDTLPDNTSVFHISSEANGASFAPAISSDGRYIAFQSLATNLVADDTNGVADIFLYDRESGETTRLSQLPDGTQANGASREPALGANGRFCAFVSEASNLVANDTNGRADVFIAFTGVK